MIKKILFLLSFTALHFLSFSQAITTTVTGTGGKLNSCGGGFGQPTVTSSYLAGAGSHVTGGTLVITDPCDTTRIQVTMSNMQWDQGSDVNWIHSVYFPANAGLTFESTTLAPAGWVYTAAGCTGVTACNGSGETNAGTVGGPGWYYNNHIAGESGACCPGGTTDNNPCNNWGDGTYDCGTPLSFGFTARICNSAILTNSLILKITVNMDGNTGCWAIGNAAQYGTLTFSLATTPFAGTLYSPAPAAATPTVTCSPAVSYSTTLTGGCGNGNTVTWWTASTGGTQVGTGSPFTYTTATCPTGTTLYAACCPVGSTCASRKAFLIGGACPSVISITGTNVTQPTCATPTGSVTVTTAGGNPTVTYTLSPGGASNTNGTFNGLNPNTYTVTASDGSGCTASTTFTINTATTGGPGPTVTSPVNYCVGAAAVPLTATGTNLMWYTVPTGGVGSATAPTPSTAAAGTTTYYVSQNPTGSCESARTPIDVIVTANATLTLTSAAGTNNQTACVNSAITNITYAVGAGGTGATVPGLPTGVTGTYSGGTNGTVTISGTPTVTGPFNYTVTTTGGCGSASATGTITVNPIATIALTSAPATAAQTVCVNNAITNITYSTGNGATGVSWTGSFPAGVTGTYNGATSTYTISGTPTNTGTFNYTLTPMGPCTTGAVSVSGSITVTPNVTMTLSSGSATPTICVNNPLTNIVYSTSNGVTNVTVSGLPTGVTGTYSGGTNGTFTISGTPTATGPFNYTVTTSGGCSVVSLTGTITVNTAATITLTSAPATANQTVNINTPITNITYGVGGGATGATVTGPLPAGVTGTFSGGVFTISGTPTVSGTFPYTVTTTGGCSSASLSGTITINNLVSLTLTSAAATANQTICINTPLTTITYVAGNGATGVALSGGAFPTGVAGSYSGGTNGTYTITGTPTVSGSFNYTLTTSGGTGSASQSGTITVNPDGTIALSSAPATTAQTLCISTPITNITYTTANGVTGASVTGLPAGVSGSYSGGINGTFTISGSPTVSGPFTYTVTTAGGCTPTTATGSITVNPNVTLTLTSAAATAAQTVCINNAITNIVYTTANGATGATVTGLPAGVTGSYSGGTNGTFTISGTPTVSGPFNYTVTTTGGCSTGTKSGTITVNPNVTLTLSSAPATTTQTVCISSPITVITYTTANGVTGITATGLPAGVSGTLSGTTYTISGTPSVSGPFNYTLTTTGGCSSATQNGSITVNPAATITLASGAASAAQTVCINTAVGAITYQTGTGATGATVTGLPAGVTGTYSGGTNGSFTITGTPTASGTFNYTVTTTGGCSSSSLSGSITVTPNVTLTLSSAASTAAQTVCVNTLLTNITYSSANGTTGATVSGLPAGVTGTYSGGTNGTFTISGTPTATGTFNYTVTTVGGCSSATKTGTITVNPNVTMTLSSAPATTAQTLCINTPITNITYNTGNGATGVTATGLPAGVTGTFAGGVFTISGSPTVAGSFNYTVTTTGGCSSVSLTGNITVNPNATITLSSASANQTLCVNTAMSAITYTTANGATGVTVTGLPAGVTGSYVGSTFTISGTPTATGTFNYTVTTTGGCSTASHNGVITVNPNVTMTLSSAPATAAQTLCINTAITNIVYATTNGATGVTATGLPAGVSGTFSGGNYTISGSPTVAGTFNYTVTTTGGCSSVTLNGSVTVNPAATIALSSGASSAAQTVCINTAINNIVYNTGNGATGATASGLPTGVTGSYAAGVFTISGTPTVAGTFNYSVHTTGGCGTATLTGTIAVTPNATITLTSAPSTTSQTLCINNLIASIHYSVANATGATLTGTLPAGVTGSFAGGIFSITGTPTAAGTFAYTVTTSGGCSSASLSGSITVNPNATITLTSSTASTAQTLCVNTAITPIHYQTANGATGATTTGLPAGVTGTWAANNYTISGTPTVPGSYTYTVKTTGGCSSASLSGTIDVIAIPAAPTVVTPVNYCPNDPADTLVATGTNLHWYTTPTGGVGSTTSPTPQTAVPGTTNYYVSQTTTAASCEGPRAQIVVNVNNTLSIQIGADTTICQGDSVHFVPVVNPPATTYAWRTISPNVPQNTITSLNTLQTTVHPVDTALYVLRGTVGGCAAEDTVAVNVRWKPIIDAGPNTPICTGNSATLQGIVTHYTGTLNNMKYAWSPIDSLSSDSTLLTVAHPVHSTWYHLTVTTTKAVYGCDFTASDSVKVIVEPPVHAFAGNDTIAVKNVPHQLNGSGGTNYIWSSPTAIISNPHSQNPTVTLNNDANIYLTVSDAIGCSASDSVFIKVYEGPQYLVPNAFSPNGDGLNDVFRVIPPGIATETYFRVYNRYGQLMFETNQWLKGWDGTYKGQAQPEGVYVWEVKGIDRNDRIVTQQGTVMLVR